jgi:hypothetical protein
MRAGNKIYDVCQDCGKLVRLNKPLLGSVHFCIYPADKPLTEENYNRIRNAYKRAFDAGR